jgi:hypothetical protein
MLMTLSNRQRMCSAADESGAYTSRRYLCSLVAQEVEQNVSVHVRNTCSLQSKYTLGIHLQLLLVCVIRRSFELYFNNIQDNCNEYYLCEHNIHKK